MNDHRAARLAAAATAVAIAGFAGPARAAGPTSPAHDPFYRYAGARPLAAIAPGTVLKARPIHLAFGTTGTPVTAEQVLYRTTGQLGQPTVTVTTVIAPARLPAATDLVDYLSFYDGLSPICDPSYMLAGGDPGGANTQQAQEEELLINWYVSSGYVVTVPDFEGTNLDWMAGRESGYGSLDAIRATESYLHLPSMTKVALSGYSGGALAADWASELAPGYAPDLNLVAVAEGGIPVDYAHIFSYIDGTTEYSSAIPGILLGLARAYHVDLRPYLSAYGRQIVRQESRTCIASTFGHYPGLTMRRLMKPGGPSMFATPVIARMLNDQIMGTVPGHPRVPLFMAVGKADRTGDGVMVDADVTALAHEYCRQGVPVELQEYQGASHVDAGAFFDPQTGPLFRERFAGGPFVGNCASIGPGGSLAPLPEPAARTRPRAAPAAARVATAVAGSRQRLAATGPPPGLPVAAAVLIAVAGLLAAPGRRRH